MSAAWSPRTGNPGERGQDMYSASTIERTRGRGLRPRVLACAAVVTLVGLGLAFAFASAPAGATGTTGTVTEYLGITSPGHPSGITAGPDGDLWFTEVGNLLVS